MTSARDDGPVRVPPNLTGVPETLLWTLHNRASEALRPDGVLDDPEAVRLYRALDYDFAGTFGPPEGSHGLRSRIFDDALRPWLAAHPGGPVVGLGCGLETQFQRCDDGRVEWYFADLPAVLELRRRLLPTDRRGHDVPGDVRDLRWLEGIDPDRPAFVTAQGLLMYFPEPDVRRLVSTILDRLPRAELMFDVVPRWFARWTVRGYRPTPRYRSPPMPWGVNRDEIRPLIAAWSGDPRPVEIVPCGPIRGWAGLGSRLGGHLPLVRRYLAHVVRVGPRAARVPDAPGH